ncbi:phage/plasmid replication protein [Sutcliffiella sp. NPDC057660]|uniref:phage/plasmid replication domain-containing protein n=1 Tax=Sutcliffiella sp. NPDC057660 TaxID=3346199 RepID=UPI0036CA60D1
MIHTARFYMDLTPDEAYLMERNLGTTLDHLQSKVDKKFNGITAWVVKQYGVRLFIVIDFIKLLDKTLIRESDYTQVEIQIEELIQCLFRDKLFFQRLNLTRIDFRLDVKLQDEERKLLFFLYRKTTSKYRHQQKYDQYKTTVYFNSKSVQCCCYDKEEEAKAKRGFIESHEAGVFRLEVRLMNQHLKYKKYRIGKEKCLKEYFQDNLFKQYMTEYFEAILYKGGYYKITKAKTIINGSCLKPAEKEKLIQFLSYVSTYGIDSAKKKFTKYYFQKFCKQLETLQINPVLIPKNKKEFPSFMKNPLSYLHE